MSDNRIFADHGPSGGPILLVTCLIHGNEPAGEAAARRLLDRLGSNPELHLSGRLVILRGNLAAAANGIRFVDRDLNRIFPADNPPDQGATDPDISEGHDREELEAIITRLCEEHPEGSRYFVDLHTTSSETLPYLSLPSPDPKSLAFARKFPLHHVTGFAQHVPGSIDRYLHERGFCGFACEGGQHDRVGSISSMFALLWMMLEECACLSTEAQISDQEALTEAHATLDRYVVGEPKCFAITYRHTLDGTEGFVMKPGYANFHRVEKGEIVARDRNGQITAPEDCYLLMPLYQSAGNDGFFLVEECEEKHPA